MKYILLDALAVENGKTGVGQYAEGLLPEIFKAAPKDIFFTVMINSCLSDDHPLVKLAERQENAELLRMDIPSIGLKRDLLFFMDRKKMKCDLFHCLYSNHPLFFKGKQIVTIHDLKYILHPEYLGKKGRFKSFYLKMLMKNAVKKCSEIITVSESTRSDLCRIFSSVENLPEKSDTVYEAASLEMKEDDAIFKKLSLDKNYFLYLGELRPHKNIGRIISAFVKFKAALPEAEDVRLIIAGKPHKSFDIREGYDRSDIIFAGYAEDKERYTLYSHALAFCFPSLYEGFGLPILEAMKSGTPVITSDFSSTAEIGGQAALLTDPLSDCAIADAMKKIFTDEAFRRRLIRLGYERERGFSWKRAAEETLEIYKRALR